MNHAYVSTRLFPNYRQLLLILTFASLCTAASIAGAQQIPLAEQIWSADVIRPSGQPVIPLFDGWFPNPDGTRSLCFGYFNLNTEQSFDIPLGDRNQLSDTRFAALLPTHFEPIPPRYRRRFCVFTVQVPADFGRDETIVWTLQSGEESLSVPAHILPAYIMDEPASDGLGNIAPLVRLTAQGEGARGRVGIKAAQTVQATTGIPVSLSAWIEHSALQVWVGWSKHSGPGAVQFDFPESQVDISNSPAVVAVTFDTPGDYVVRLQTIDDTADFEFYCCHTNAYFSVSVGK